VTFPEVGHFGVPVAPETAGVALVHDSPRSDKAVGRGDSTAPRPGVNDVSVFAWPTWTRPRTAYAASWRDFPAAGPGPEDLL
jgi:hypothetical protein